MKISIGTFGVLVLFLTFFTHSSQAQESDSTQGATNEASTENSADADTSAESNANPETSASNETNTSAKGPAAPGKTVAPVGGRAEAEMPKLDEMVPLRFSPGAVDAKLGVPLLLFERSDTEFSFAHRDFATEKNRFVFQDGTLTLNWDTDQLKPSRVVVLDKEGEVLSESAIAPNGMSISIGEDLRLDSASQLESKLGSLKIKLNGDDAIMKTLQICLWDEMQLDGKADTQIFCGPLGRSSDLTQGRFTIDGKAQPAKGEYQPKKNGVFEMTYASSSGMSLRWTSVAPTAKIHEVFLRRDKKIEMVMYDGVVAGQADVLTEDRGAMFEATIGDLRKFSRVVLPSAIPFLNLKGPRNSVIHQKLLLKAMPSEIDRVFLSKPAPKSTYKSMIKLWGPYRKGQILDSKQNLVEIYDDEFKWEFAAPKKYAWNRSRLFLRNSNISGSKSKTTVFDYEVYRGFSTYLSARLGISLSSKLAASAALDLNFIHWFEDLWSAASWSRQRWGVSAGYMKTVISSKPEEKYETTYMDLNYRFTPGVEGWDESVGLQASFFNIKYRETEPTWMGGVGLFWNRSLPSWFNYLVGFLDFFKKPKWANFSAVYYGVPLQSGRKANGFQLKAVARIDLSQTSYFEGGWALFAATYEYSKTRVQTGAGRAYLGYGYRW